MKRIKKMGTRKEIKEERGERRKRGTGNERNRKRGNEE